MYYVLTIRLSHALRCQGMSGSLALHTAVAMGKLSRDQLLQKAYSRTDHYSSSGLQ